MCCWPADWSLLVLCPIPDGCPSIPMVPGAWAAQAGARIYQRLDGKANKHCHRCGHSASSSSSRRTSPFSSLPEAGRENQLKKPVYVSMAVLDPGSQGTLTPAAGPAREMGQEKVFF